MEYKVIKPDPSLTDFVDSFWMLKSEDNQNKEIIVLPDGRVDIIFEWSEQNPLHVMLMTLDQAASAATLPARTIMFAVSMKIPALEYILDIKQTMNSHPKLLPNDFMGITSDDLKDFDSFVDRISRSMLTTAQSKNIDSRKKKLFEMIYETDGAMTVGLLAERSCWSARQINRYFNDWTGISLKKYSNILKFRASFAQLREGKLFPRGEFFDQPHFIKLIKKLSGVTPKELSKNKNDRFIQFSASTDK
ncbi:helix-turn-helix domain-containing protein [Pedobacter duraquae]|uniref:HTH araC/xylS-type domain-containing protein n=1 Tax=Pedobacter duraquae TaxID=425511 RepID=A0A4R6IGH8_9SPHI|nr:DUF6597 domain-containing transcriptional factor [Pedobacter duraquae]TDO20828.1 hypothetical protein CLV32_3462 [Pedobacter duraquae]